MKYGLYDCGENPHPIEAYVQGAHILVVRTVQNYVETVISLEDEGWEVRDCLKVLMVDSSYQVALMRKPFKGTTVNNILKYGCGGINIDGCRIHTDGEQPKGSGKGQKNTITHGDRNDLVGGSITPPEGRFPANLILQNESVPIMDGQSGILKSGGGNKSNRNSKSAFGGGAEYDDIRVANSGGASRYFQKYDSREELFAYLEKLIRVG